MDQWTGTHRAFVVRAYYKNNDSISAAQRVFKRHFSIYQIPPVNVVKAWVRNFECTGSANAMCVRRMSFPVSWDWVAVWVLMQSQIYCTICNNCLSNEKNFTSNSTK